MQYSAALLTVLPLALANTIRVDVGNGGLVFAPSRVQALPGDILEFHFYPKNHSVTQSTFAAPCQPILSGVNSGFNPVNDTNPAATAQRFQVQVNDTRPLWFYCAQGAHCQSGMSMVVNEPNSKNTLSAYQDAARNAVTGVNPVAPQGGSFSASDRANSTATHDPWSTYTSTYSTYSTSTNGAATTVTLVETVTALTNLPASSTAAGSSSTTGSASGSASPSSTGNAAPTMAAAGWAVAAGAAALGGLLI